MKQRMIESIEGLQRTEGGHILYYFRDIERYADNVVAFILSNVKLEHHILIIENDKITPLIRNKLKPLIIEEQWNYVHFINNFDFYFTYGDFHEAAIPSYFMKIAQPYLDNGTSLRAWSHVEWGHLDTTACLIERVEKMADEQTSALGLTLVCAYEVDRLPDTMKDTLVKHHQFIMTDEKIISTDQ
ncbi:MEDS domain-containing protein [Bacillus thermotolerans]|uniref:MEDS domain-containing protein n=1 Tax=Bacillus thermotolerans TaxID=1221996 RepID=UPI00058959FF|nr:MEDS domain-containing protein [Bacillus thermotolerans]KKB44284.1 hypothetical protein QY96_03306 [Bacillus thermotolerans]